MVNYLYSNQQPSEVSVTKQAQISNHLNYGIPINMSVTQLGQEKLVKLVNWKPLYYAIHALLSHMILHIMHYCVHSIHACIHPKYPGRGWGGYLGARLGVNAKSHGAPHCRKVSIVIYVVLKITSRLTERSCSNYDCAKH